MTAIKELRSAANMSQSRFASYLGIPVANIQHWEQGVSNPPDYIPMLIYRVMKADGYIEEPSYKADEIVRQTQASMAIEDMALSDSAAEGLRKMALGAMTREEYQSELKQRYNNARRKTGGHSQSDGNRRASS